ncbi:MAG: cytochrome c maturation protein CcmE [Gammaproteobacteria bacterium]|jgi:cytochrome c-type biogenesis protein CcmE|nr:cytochrome c maturation protein CcmE [Gammaproteobacteria bacterium]
MKARHKRLVIIVAGLAVLGVALTLIFNAFNSNMVFFFSPSDVQAKQAPVDRTFRLGGLVEEGSLKREDDGLTVHFMVTDNANTIPVIYTGILPDLFREGQGVVAQGKLDAGGVFKASEVLAKHDETYMPPEVADALEKAKKQTSASISE